MSVVLNRLPLVMVCHYFLHSQGIARLEYCIVKTFNHKIFGERTKIQQDLRSILIKFSLNSRIILINCKVFTMIISNRCGQILQVVKLLREAYDRVKALLKKVCL